MFSDAMDILHLSLHVDLECHSQMLSPFSCNLLTGGQRHEELPRYNRPEPLSSLIRSTGRYQSYFDLGLDLLLVNLINPFAPPEITDQFAGKKFRDGWRG